MEGRTLGKATRGRKRLQTQNLKSPEDGSLRQDQVAEENVTKLPFG